MRSHICLLLTVLAWGIEYPLFKQCIAESDFLAAGATTFSIAALMLGISVLVSRTRKTGGEPQATPLGLYGAMVLIGCVGFSANILVLLALKLTPAINVSTLSRSDVLFSLLLSSAFFRERIHPSVWLCTPIMLFGICLLTGILLHPTEWGNGGDYLVLVSALLISLNAFIIKRTVQGVSGLTIGFVNTLVNGLAFQSVILFWRGPSALLQTYALSGRLPFLLLGCLCYLFFATYNTALRTIPVWEVRLLCLLVPVVTALTGWCWLGEVPTGVQLSGMLLIVGGGAGIILSQRQ